MQIDRILDAISDQVSEVDRHSLLRYIILLLASALVLLVIYKFTFVLSQLIHNHKFRKNAVVLRILPQNTSDILLTERFIMYLHGLLLNTKWRVITEGQPYIAYEIVGRHKRIEFFVWLPAPFKKSIEEQIYINYPDCVVEEVEDHMVPLHVARKKIRQLKKQHREGSFKRKIKKLYVRGMEMKLGYNNVFPTAEKVDIVDTILGGMTGLEWHEKLVLQVILKPLDRQWQVRGRKIIKDYEKKGIRPDSARGREQMKEEISGFGEQLRNELGNKAHSQQRNRAVDNARTDRKEIREASEKVIKSGFATQIRILGIGFYGKGIKIRVRSLASAFHKLDGINRFKKKLVYPKRVFYQKVQRRYTYGERSRSILTPGELAGFFLRMPDLHLLVSEVVRNKLKQLPPPLINFEKERNVLGQIIFKSMMVKFGLKEEDARRHIHVIGGIGSGKSELLKYICLQAVDAGKGLVLMDPHGKLADEVVQLIPKERLKDVLYYDFSDSEYPVPFNFMKVQGSRHKSKADIIDETAEEFLNIMKNVFSDSWGVRTEKIFRHTGKALMEANDGSLWNAKQMLKNREYRQKVVGKIRNIAVKDFWETEFIERQTASGGYKLDSEMKKAIDSPLTKLDRFLSSERILYMVAQDDCIDFDECINKNKIVIFKVPKGDLKEDNTQFLGNIVFSKLMMAFMSRKPEEMMHETLLLVDEVQNFVTTNPKDFEVLMDELRKYGVQFVMAHQRVSQIQPIISAVRDNVGTTVCFKLGEESSSYMSKGFAGYLESRDLEQLEMRYAYVRALVDGKKTDPFLLRTLDRREIDPEEGPAQFEAVREANRKARKSKSEVEKLLRSKLIDVEQIGSDFRQEEDADYINAANRFQAEERVPASREQSGLPKEWL